MNESWRTDIVECLVLLFIIDPVALAKQGDNRIGSIRPFVCVSVGVFVRALLFKPFDP